MLANEPEQSRTPRLDPVCGIELVVQDGRQRRHLSPLRCREALLVNETQVERRSASSRQNQTPVGFVAVTGEHDAKSECPASIVVDDHLSEHELIAGRHEAEHAA
jgi:hypothetical protein